MTDLFETSRVSDKVSYSATDIEVLEGLEPVRHRPGMYIGGVDDRALHHLAAEILDNSMDEAVAGYATNIEVCFNEDFSITIKDNGRGIPVDAHPKYPNKSALEVILTTLHSGGKFSGKAYAVSGGLHGVGLSVVNALSEELVVEVAREKTLWKQSYSKGVPLGPLEEIGKVSNRRGTSIRFRPDPEIFGVNSNLNPSKLFRMVRQKAFLFKGVKILWKCAESLLSEDDPTPAEMELHFPNGVTDFLNYLVGDKPTINRRAFAGEADLSDNMGKVEWAVTWPDWNKDGFCNSYCNTVPTPLGGTHENGFKLAITKSLKSYGEMAGNRKAANINTEDILGSAGLMMSVFIRDPQFQGQTKEKLVSIKATKLVENAVNDFFDHWLTEDTENANAILEYAIERADARKRAREVKEQKRKTVTKRLRLPGKLSDCSRTNSEGTEIFIVEGDSAGGSAKQGRNRETQAILPLKGKILNVASATKDKINANQEIRDLIEALGCGTRDNFNSEKLRYEKVIIMTDADVDGAHIASLLMTLFYREMRGLIEQGHLYLATPPLYKITLNGNTEYAIDDEDKDRIVAKLFKGSNKVDISRFKGLGEMSAKQLKETTMDVSKRTLLKVCIPDVSTEEGKEEAFDTQRRVEHLMGKNPELRFKFIKERAKFVTDLDV